MDATEHNNNDRHAPHRHRWVYPDASKQLTPDSDYAWRRSWADGSEVALRTHLTPVKGFGQLLARFAERTPVNMDRVVSSVDHLNTQITALEELILHFLTAARLHWDGRDMAWHAVDLPSLAHQVAGRFDDSADRSAGQAIEVEALDGVEGVWDVHWLGEAIGALVSNALRYTPDGGEIRITIRRRDDRALVSISDSGLGVMPEERERIFLPFTRGSAAQMASHGHGLGLFIAGRVAAVHGGVIEVESAPRAGSVFTMALPLVPPVGSAGAAN